jgi:diguanylate cyclase (GGDEF)-like protein
MNAAASADEHSQPTGEWRRAADNRGKAINSGFIRADSFYVMLSTPPMRLLVIEDDPDTAELIIETLRDAFGPGCVHHVSCLLELREIDIERVDMVLSDMNLPDGSGLEALSYVLLKRPDLPVILVTGEGIIENAARAIKQGAYDYIVKAGDYLFAIPLMVEKNLAIHRTKCENLRLQEELTRTIEEVRIKNEQLELVVGQLEAMASTDPLTGLANRRAFNHALARCFAEADRYGQDLACIMIDMDGFKALNDTLGHQRGDELLQRSARVHEANCRKSDIAGRFGGDEFVLLLPQTGEQVAIHVAHRVAEEFAHAAKLMLKGLPLADRVSLSIGVACQSVCRAINPEQLIAAADHALYRAKQTGRNRVVVYAPGAEPRGESHKV